MICNDMYACGRGICLTLCMMKIIKGKCGKFNTIKAHVEFIAKFHFKDAYKVGIEGYPIPGRIMRKYHILDWIRQTPLTMGEARDIVAKELKRGREIINPEATPRMTQQGDDKPMTTLAMNQQGAYGEVFLPLIYPQLSPIQDYVVYHRDTAEADFFDPQFNRYEVRTPRFYTENYKEAHLNKDIMDKKSNQSKYTIVTAINDHPKIATIFYEVGWMLTENVLKCDTMPGTRTPDRLVYLVPIDELQDLRELLTKGSVSVADETNILNLSSFMKNKGEK